MVPSLPQRAKSLSARPSGGRPQVRPGRQAERLPYKIEGLQLAREKAFFLAMRIIISAVIASVACVVWTSPVSAQDPAVVQAKTVKVKFENDRVRVLEAEVPPGVKEEMHSHPAYVIYVVEGGKFRNYAADGKTSEGELKTGEVVYREPLTHAAENIGTTTAHLILIELKTAPSR